MDIKQGILKLAIGISEGIGSLLFLFGFISFEKGGEYSMAIVGALVVIVSQAIEIPLTLNENQKKLQQIYDEFLNKIGAIVAWPALIFIIYLMNPHQSLRAFALAITIIAVVRATSLVIKVYLIDNILHTE